MSSKQNGPPKPRPQHRESLSRSAPQGRVDDAATVEQPVATPGGLRLGRSGILRLVLVALVAVVVVLVDLLGKKFEHRTTTDEADELRSV